MENTKKTPFCFDDVAMVAQGKDKVCMCVRCGGRYTAKADNLRITKMMMNKFNLNLDLVTNPAPGTFVYVHGRTMDILYTKVAEAHNFAAFDH